MTGSPDRALPSLLPRTTLADLHDTNVCGVMFRYANVPRALDVVVDGARLLRAGPPTVCSFTVRTSFLYVVKLLCDVWSGQWWSLGGTTVYVSPRDRDVLS